jgi:uncharacterized membrane protein YhiD involved in acid resistance
MNTQISFNPINFSLLDLTINFAIGIVLSGLISIHYSYRAKKRVLRKDIALTLPVIALTTLLVITVVKSSLALSLGLVGALSIVRFRTPIKEPEELAYIFMAISVGLCLGADQREAAIAGVLIILTTFSVYSYFPAKDKADSSNLILTFHTPTGNDSENLLSEITGYLSARAKEVNIRRIDDQSDQFSLTCIANFKGLEDIEAFLAECRVKFPDSKITLIDDFSFPNE